MKAYELILLLDKQAANAEVQILAPDFKIYDVGDIAADFLEPIVTIGAAIKEKSDGNDT